MKKRFICTASSYRYTPASCRWANIDDKGFIDGETPIEDFGMFMILDKEISSESADRIFFALLGDEEGQQPEIKEEITKDDELYRSSHLPQLLTPKENEIYLSLTNK